MTRPPNNVEGGTPGGTPWFMPPESVSCLKVVVPNNICPGGMAPVEFGTDWWAWGVLLYWAVFNRHPFCIGCHILVIEGKAIQRNGDRKYTWIRRNLLDVEGAIAVGPGLS